MQEWGQVGMIDFPIDTTQLVNNTVRIPPVFPKNRGLRGDLQSKTTYIVVFSITSTIVTTISIYTMESQ